VQPKPEDYEYDLDRALAAIVGVRTTIPADAFTAETLGTERAGHGVIIRNDGLVLTIGYLVTEAETVWLTLAGGGVVPGHVLGYDQETGFGLVQALARIEVPALTLGASAKSKVGDHVVVAGGGGRKNAVAARIVAKQEFAGYWEYLIDEAIFTSPSHPHWGGTGLICPEGKLIGIGSLQVQQGSGEGGSGQQSPTDINMIVPIDLLKPVLEDLTTIGRPSKSPRPWLGIFAAEVGDRIVIAGMSRRGPASKSSLKIGDIVMSVAGHDVRGLPTFFRNVWALGPAGAPVPLTINRNGRTMDVTVQSGDRRSFLRGPVLH
jgi:S1-C subfamily serine protease